MKRKPLASRITVEGLDRAPHRAFLRAMGLTDSDLARPFVGVVTTQGNVTPCNAGLGAQAAEYAKGYAWPLIAEKIVNVYESVIGDKVTR